ncbi:MAG: hypothetical protein HC802_03500 [Caldilineaceae bacterium]|nr:hypothetical protein [Caldilineaceae bacterium]
MVVQFAEMTQGGLLPIGTEQIIDNIPTGGTGTAQVSYDTSGREGEHLIQVTIDPNDSISELDESDNQASKPLTIAPPPAPNLVITADDVSSSGDANRR